MGESEESGKEYRCYIRIFSYPMPDSSLRVRLCSFFCHYSGSACRSRMMARENCVFREVVNDFSPKKKSTGNVSGPRLSGKVSTDRLTKGASVSKHVKRFLTKR